MQESNVPLKVKLAIHHQNTTNSSTNSKQQQNDNSNSITLRNVLYHPQFVDNLLSVGAICSQHGNRVVFEGECALLYFNSNNNNDSEQPPTITAQRHNNPYAIKHNTNSITATTNISDHRVLRATTTTNSTTITTTNNNTSTLSNNALSRVMDAHCRYGHASLGKLRELIKNGTVPGIAGVTLTDLNRVKQLNCLSCKKAKITRPAFSTKRSNDEVHRALERVSTDITGPLPENRFGPRWVSLVIDQFSSYMDLRTIKIKAKAPAHVEAALTMLQRQSELQVKAIRCDGLLKYDVHASN